MSNMSINCDQIDYDSSAASICVLSHSCPSRKVFQECVNVLAKVRLY